MDFLNFPLGVSGARAAQGVGEVVRDAGPPCHGDPAPDDHPHRGLYPGTCHLPWPKRECRYSGATYCYPTIIGEGIIRRYGIHIYPGAKVFTMCIYGLLRYTNA